MKDAYYFPHDCNAHKDPKILSLRLKCKWEGVGIFWALVEILRDSPGYKYTNDLATLELSLSTAQATLEATMKACYEIGLLVEKDGFFSSPALDRRMADIDRRRGLLRDAGRRGGLKSSQAQAKLKPSSSNPQAVKESKVKERKGNTTSPLFASFWEVYPKKIGKGAAEQAFGKIKGIESIIENIVAAVKEQKECDQWQKDGGQFIPNPATWLNQRRWEDEVQSMVMTEGGQSWLQTKLKSKV